MKYLFSTIEPLYFLAIFQALLLTAYLIIQKKGNANSRTILASLLVVFVVFLTGMYLLLFKGRWHYNHYAHLMNLTVFLVPPLLYFYFQSLADQSFRVTYKMLYHALPFLLIFFIMFYKFGFDQQHKLFFKPMGIFMISFLFIQNLIYLLWLIRDMGGFNTTNILNGKTKWFRYLFLSIFIIFMLKLLIFIVWNIFGYVEFCIYLTGLFFIYSFFIINILVLYGLFYPDVLANLIKYQSSPLDNALKEKCYAELMSMVQVKKAYRDPLLGLERLSKSLSVSPKQLSQVINEYTCNNFNDFINKFRIEEAKERIMQDKDMNIMDIAYEVGFNAKSTFNTAFKKFTGMTPTEFRKNIA